MNDLQTYWRIDWKTRLPATVNSLRTLCSHNHNRTQIYSLFHMLVKIPAAGMLFSGGEW